MITSWIKSKVEGDKDAIIDKLAKQSEGYSGADLKVFCNAVDMIPIEQLTQATHFRLTEIDGQKYYCMCKENDKGALRCSLNEIGAKAAQENIQVKECPVNEKDIMECFSKNNKSTDARDLEKHIQFNKEFGTE